MSMRIQDIGRLQVSLARLAQTGISQPGGGPQFAVPSPAAQSAQAARMPLPASVTGLRSFATTDLQAQRKRSIGQGRSVIDGLDQLKLAMLSGAPGMPQLRQLAGALDDLDAGDDPDLDDILNAIRLRAEVEIAKAEVTRPKSGAEKR